MRDKACQAISKLNKLDLARMYDDNVDIMVELISRKINMDGFAEISELESVKYLMAFFVIVENGPKMSFEQNLMKVETKVDELYFLDEYEALNEIWQALKDFLNHSINFALIKNIFEMMDIRDCALIQKSFGISTEDADIKEAELLDTFGKIRAFKERSFEHGAWNMTYKLVLGEVIEMEEFARIVNRLRKNWSKISEFKTSERKIKLSTGIRNVDVYSIGELEFTDPYEVMFLYLERNFIKNQLIA